MLNSNLQSDYNASAFFKPDAFVQQSLELPVFIDLYEQVPENDISRTVLRCIEEAGLIRYIDGSNRDCDDYSAYDMLKAVLLSCTLNGQASLRDMEEMARNDIRFRLIFHGSRTPSHMAFHRFINNNLAGNVETLLTKLNLYMAGRLPEDINPENEEIDGTKEEADANKMTFVWRKASEKFNTRCCKKVFEILKEMIAFFNSISYKNSLSVLRSFDLQYMMEIALFLEKYAKEAGIEFVYGKGKRKNQIQRWYDKLKDCAVHLWKYQMHFDILGDRNSFSKTDPDATFMHMKYDYYNHTNVFKPGYNVQMGNVNGFIWDIYISADCSDQRTYIPLLEQHFKNYGSYPKRTGADAGYGGYDNYKFCKDHGIELFMKYSGYEKKKEKPKTDTDKFKAFRFKTDENGMPVCPAGHSFRVESVRTETRGIYPREMETLVNDHCIGCPFQAKCTKAKSGIRKIQRCVQLNEWQEEADRNLDTELGKKIMRNRQIFSEGIFGDKKYNWKYDKMHRIGKSGVKTEIYLYSFGKNLRRFHSIYWDNRNEEEKKLQELLEFARSVMPA